MTDTTELVSETRSFGGWYRRYRHHSQVLGCDMVFGIYLPPQAETQTVPLLWWLSGLTCTDENFMQKAGAHRVAAELGMAIICPDTSPRGTDLPGEHDSYDFGSGAGFYVDATQAPWDQHYQMYSYVTDELPDLVHNVFPLNSQEAIAGHSMGGHGALICALHHPERYQSVSAFAPVCHPINCAWGEKAFGAYLGDDRVAWKAWDASELIRSKGTTHSMLVDQGGADNFLEAGQLQPEALEAACAEAGADLTLRHQPGYDHSYFFIASFIEDHLRFHSDHLCR